MRCLISWFPLILAILWFDVSSATIINVPTDSSTIQGGINGSTDGDTVLVQPGIYNENVNFDGHNILLGSLFVTLGDSSYIDSTIIDGSSSGSVIRFESSENNSAVICGFIIRNGSAFAGGGINCTWTNPTICHNKIINNTSTNIGGGIFCTNNPEIRNNIISSNSCGVGGGGIHTQGNPLIIDNIISNNTGYWAGGIGCYGAGGPNPVISGNQLINNDGLFVGGILCRELSPIINNNKIHLNSGDTGGILCFGNNANPIIKNNMIWWNDGNLSGGGITFWGGTNSVTSNNTLFFNWAAGGGGIHCDNSSPSIRNTILWMNWSAQSGDQIGIVGNSSPTVIYSDVEGGWEGEGNLDCDPLFCSTYWSNFYLDSLSCCIGAGCDTLGIPDSTINIGAFGIGCYIRCNYKVGDINGSNSFNGLDVTYGVTFLKGGNDPLCEDCQSCPDWHHCGDVNGSCSYNGLDITYGVSYLKGEQTSLVSCSECPPAY